MSSAFVINTNNIEESYIDASAYSPTENNLELHTVKTGGKYFQDTYCTVKNQYRIHTEYSRVCYRCCEGQSLIYI